MARHDGLKINLQHPMPRGDRLHFVCFNIDDKLDYAPRLDDEGNRLLLVVSDI